LVILIVFFFLSTGEDSLRAQNEIRDSFQLALSQKIPDSARIDRINQLIFRYSSSFPGTTILYADSAVAIAIGLQDSVRLALAYNRKGIALYYGGDYNGSLENYFAALSVKERIGASSSLWREYNNIGLVLRELKYDEEALKYFKLALEGMQKEQNNYYTALAWNNIAIACRALGKKEEALDALNKAMQLNLILGADQTLAYNYNNLGNIFYDNRDFPEAIRNYQRAIEINIRLGNKYEQLKIYTNIGQALIESGDYPHAYQQLKTAEKLTDEIDIIQLHIDLLEVFSRYYAAIGDFKKAYQATNLFTHLSDSINQEGRVKQFDQLRSLASVEKKIQEVEFLKKINTIQKERIHISKIIQIGGGSVILIILLLLFLVYRNFSIKKKLSVSLAQRTNEIESLNIELSQTNEELRSQRDNLEDALNNLQKAQHQLIQSEKMASVGTLASGIAHEINNPLNFIKGGVYALENYLTDYSAKLGISDRSDLEVILGSIHQGVDRSAEIVKSLSCFTSKNSDEKVKCNLHDAINNCLVVLTSQMGDRIIVRKNFGLLNPEIICNESKLHQALLNIITNSIQAIGKDGVISFQSLAVEDRFKILIEDNGSGIPNEILSRIMDPFFSTKGPDKGTGLGLSISYQIIRELGGSLDIVSEEGKGTSVILHFPASGDYALE
jgi:signal transduction histidine kinase